MFSEYASRLREEKTAFIVPLFLGGAQDSIQAPGTTRLTRSRRTVREHDSSDENDFDNQEEEARQNIASMNKKRPRVNSSHIYRQASTLINTLFLFTLSSLCPFHFLILVFFSSVNDRQRLLENALKKEILVPIKLDFEVDDYRIQDSFSWNLNETSLTPEIFAEIMCADLDLPIGPGLASEYIADAIYDQISNHRIIIDQLEQRSQSTLSLSSQVHTDSIGLDFMDPELRVPINIEIVSGQFVLRDMIEWDLGINPISAETSNFVGFGGAKAIEKLFNKLECTKTPEYFSKKLCSELGIGGEFVPLVANNIREQLVRFQRERLEVISRLVPRKIKSSISFDHVDTGTNKSTLSPVVEDSSDEKKVPSKSMKRLGSLTKLALQQLNKNNSNFDLPPKATMANSSDTLVDLDVDARVSGWYSDTAFRQKPVSCVLRDSFDAENWGPSFEVLSADEIYKMLMGQERSRRRLRRSERSQTKSLSFSWKKPR